MIGIGPKGIGNGGGAQAVAERLSTALHTRVPAADAAKLMRAYASRNPRAIRNAMAKYARQWKALDAKAKARITAQLGQTQEGAAALFESYSGEGLAATMVTAQFPPAGACVILPQNVPSAKPLVSAALDAGASLFLTGAASALPLISGRKGQYHAAFGSSITGPDVPLGSYTISGTGGADVGAFSSTITVGSHLAISNKSSLDAVNPTQPSTITWTGGVAGNYVLIAGYTPSAFSNNESLPQAFFNCTEDGGKGTLTIPSYILTAMNAAVNAQGLLLISPHPLSNQIAIPGIDLAYFIDGSSDSANVTWSGAATPAAPVLSAPANNATGVPTAPMLAWSASTGATSYVVYLGTSSSPPQVATVTGTTYSPSSLSPGTTYYWKVAAANANGNTTSPTFSFTTKVTGTGSQTIAFGPIGNQTLGSGSVPLAAIASSGLPVAFTSNSPAVCTVSGPMLILAGSGVCSITASQPGNSVYAAAVPVTQTFTVSAVTTGPQALQLITVTPCRIIDTRNANGPLGGPFIAGGTTRAIPIPSSACGIPANAAAYSLNFTVVPRAGALSYLTVWPAGQAQPFVSTLNSLDGSTIANAAIVPAGVGGAINAFATNDTDLIVDINGYFAPPAANTLQFYTLPPCRVLDTRNQAGVFGGPSIAGGTSRTFPIPSSSCGVPANAAAYAFNVTVVPQGELAYLTVWPTGQPLPLVSTLNSFDGTVLANAAIVPAGTGGAANFYASNTTDLVVDINGYFAPPGLGGLNFYPVTPCRLVDTRNANGALGGPTLGPSTTRTFPLSSGSCGLPGFPGAQAYSLNMTVVPQGFLAYLSTWPAGVAQPVVSTLNAFKGQVVANAAIVPAGGAGSIDVFVTNTTDVVIDTNGYFGSAASGPNVANVTGSIDGLYPASGAFAAKYGGATSSPVSFSVLLVAGTFTVSFNILPGAQPFQVVAQSTIAPGVNATISINPAQGTWQAVYTVPTPAERAWDFSGYGSIVFDYDAGGSGLPFPGNIIPGSRTDPTALAALALLPLPNTAPTAAPNATFVSSGTLPPNGQFTINASTLPGLANFGGFTNIANNPGTIIASFQLYVDNVLVASKQVPFAVE